MGAKSQLIHRKAVSPSWPTLSFILKTGVVKSTSQGVAMEVNDVTEYKSEYLVRGGILLLLVRTTEDG